MNETLFDESTLLKLERLSLVARRVRAGTIKGERRSTKRGSALEFADYRDYARGDDLRRVDWNVYARLERPFIKLFEEEEDLAVHILLDNSRSMEWGEGEHNKWRYGLRLTGALAQIALATGDRVTVQMGGNRAQMQRFGPVRGGGQIFRLLDWLASQQAAGPTNLNRDLREYAKSGGRPGVLFLISDLLCEDDFRDGAKALLGRGYEVSVLHILAPDEVDPPLSGDLRLVDVETGEEQEVTIDRRMRNLYAQHVDVWREETMRWCHSRQVHYVPIVTVLPWEKLVMQTLRKTGLLK